MAGAAEEKGVGRRELGRGVGVRDGAQIRLREAGTPGFGECWPVQDKRGRTGESRGSAEGKVAIVVIVVIVRRARTQAGSTGGQASATLEG